MYVWPVLAAAVSNPSPEAQHGPHVVGSTLLGWLTWGGLIAGIVGLMVCGIMMMIGGRKRSASA